jgi:hypothetical protein
MSADRRTARIAGVLFVVATLAALAAAALLPALSGTGYLTRVADHPNQVAAAALLYLVAAFASAGIAVSLYPVVSRFDAGMAAGSVVFRTIEAVLYTAAVVSLLSLWTLGDQVATAGAADRVAYQTVGDSLVATREHASLAGVFAFGVGAFLYYLVFYRSRLIPRWLSGWGIAGVVLMLAACMLALFSDSPVTGYVPLALPIAVQELVFAVWLLVKGFSSTSAAPSRAAS